METVDPKPTDPGLLALVSTHFEVPATDDLVRRTTAELHKLINDHAPGAYSIGEVYQVFSELQFRTQLVGDELFWLVKTR